MAVIHAKDATFGYDEAGAGQAVVLVHGALGDRRMWDHQFHALAERYRVIRYDWRGYGESSDPVREVAHHEDMLAVLDALDVDQAVLVGCSFGASHAVDLALSAPQRVRGLVLVSPGLQGYEFDPDFRAMATRKVGEAVPQERLVRYRNGTADHIDPADIAAMAEVQLRMTVVGPGRTPEALPPGMWSRAMEMCQQVFLREWTTPPYEERCPMPPAAERLAEVGVPTLVINGLADETAVQAVADFLVAGIKGARRLDLPDTGHHPSMERPEELTDALVEFLGTV